MRIIKVKDLDCRIVLTIKRRNKNVYMRIKNQILYITSPVNLKDEYIKNMILKNYDIIYKKLTMPPLSFSTIHFLGEEYKINIVKSEHDNIYYSEDFFYIHTKNNSQEYIKRLVHLFYADELKKIVKKYIEDIKKEFNINFDIDFKYKNVETYYGECFFKKRIIILATKLAKYNLECILNVIYHEMAHFYFQNHGKEFYNLLEKIRPNYKELQRTLKRTKYNDGF